MAAPTPLHDNPKTIFEWFLNVYYWYDGVNAEGAERELSAADRKKVAMAAWCRFRRVAPDILRTKDKGAVLEWIPSDWAALRGHAPSVETDIAYLNDDEDNADEGEGEGEGVQKSDSEPLPAKPPVAKSAPEPVESDDEDDGDDEEVEVNCKREYFEDYWVHELRCSVEKWTVEDVRDFIMSVSRSARAGAQPRLVAIAKAAFISDIDGMLLEAGGAELLVQKTVGNVKWETGLLRKDGYTIMQALKEHKLKNSHDYFKRNKRLQSIYTTSALLPTVTAILQPVPYEEVLYTTLCSRESSESCAVTSLNDDVGKRCSKKSEHKFKVVAVTPHDSPREVSHNLIYYRNGNRWVLLFSVDFMKHGEEAPSGHWHINRAPLGELIPHWGPSNSVFHGTPDSCPIWWQLIPKGTTYLTLPERNPLRSWVS